MSSTTQTDAEVYALMWSLRKFTRTSLMLQQIIAERAGLHATDAECIDFLMEMGPSTAGSLAKATRLTTGAITNVIDRLERAGFVKRGPDPKDRRKVVVTYIPEKKTGISESYAALAANVQQHLSTYTKEELELLTRYTDALNEVYSKA